MGARNYEAIARRRPARHVIDVDDGATSVPIGILGSSAGLLVPAYCRSAPVLPVFIRAAGIVVADNTGGEGVARFARVSRSQRLPGHVVTC